MVVARRACAAAASDAGRLHRCSGGPGARLARWASHAPREGRTEVYRTDASSGDTGDVENEFESFSKLQFPRYVHQQTQCNTHHYPQATFRNDRRNLDIIAGHPDRLIVAAFKEIFDRQWFGFGSRRPSSARSPMPAMGLRSDPPRGLLPREFCSPMRAIGIHSAVTEAARRQQNPE